METSGWYALSTLAAIALGPILAVLVTRYIDGLRDRRRRRMEIFKNLMQTRGQRLDPLHVFSLNLIELEFYKEREVLTAFKNYVQHLSSPSPTADSGEEDRYFDQRLDLFVELIATMGKTLGYKFDKRDLERHAYSPQGWGDNQNLQQANAILLNNLLSGRMPLPVSNFMGQDVGSSNQKGDLNPD